VASDPPNPPPQLNTNSIQDEKTRAKTVLKFTLTLYRRHTKTCTKGYPQNHRIFKPTTKTERAADCVCPICAEGTLHMERLISNRSTKQITWNDAEAIARRWEDWGQTTAPAVKTADPNTITVGYAVDSFLTSQGPTGSNAAPKTCNAFSILLKQRLLPYCSKKNFVYIREFDSLDAVDKFTQSWINLQPTRNRNNVPAPSIAVLLSDATKKAELERFRHFGRYCRDRDWLDHVYAEKIRIEARTKKKFGMERDEEERIFSAIKRQSLRVFCLTMRHAGLRISDATTLNENQLVQRASGRGYALKVFQKKPQEWVYMPIPDWVAAELEALPFEGEVNGIKYWFWSGNGAIDTAINNWYRKISRIVKAVEQTHKFLNPVSPHVFRHTFAISHLNAGTDVKFVSRWLGHASTGVTERHYSHAIRSTMLASEEAYDASLRQQEETAARRLRERMTLVGL